MKKIKKSRIKNFSQEFFSCTLKLSDSTKMFFDNSTRNVKIENGFSDNSQL